MLEIENINNETDEYFWRVYAAKLAKYDPHEMTWALAKVLLQETVNEIKQIEKINSGVIE